MTQKGPENAPRLFGGLGCRVYRVDRVGAVQASPYLSWSPGRNGRLSLCRTSSSTQRVVSQKKGDPSIDPNILESLLLGPPKYVTPDLRKAQYLLRASTFVESCNEGTPEGRPYWTLERP